MPDTQRPHLIRLYQKAYALSTRLTPAQKGRFFCFEMTIEATSSAVRAVRGIAPDPHSLFYPQATLQGDFVPPVAFAHILRCKKVSVGQVLRIAIPLGGIMPSMRYYEVFVAEASYQKQEPLTYSSSQVLRVGTVVLVPYGKKQVSGFVVSLTSKPDFATKQIAAAPYGVVLPESIIKLHAWMASYYPGGGALTQLFVPSGLEVKHRPEATAKEKAIVALPPLTQQQKKVVDTIHSSGKKTFLLHGETGSGKTRVYLEQAQRHIRNGKSVLILTPEISLVPQLQDVFGSVFGGRVVTMHSGLTRATRGRNWLKIISSTEPLVVIGTRSALFCPLSNIGLIVVDEAHEPAYKQESVPRYYGLRVAGQAAKIHESEIIYGSATPPVVEYYVASQTDTPTLRIDKTALPAAKSERLIIDLKDKSQFSRHPALSDTLLAAIERRLNDGEQSLLFLNRRGTARQILCQACGWQAACPNCDMPLTYHGDSHQMRCHTCGYHGRPPYACPRCGSDNIVYRSLGTKALVDALHSLFPQALIKRFDTDNLAAERLQEHFEDIKSGKIDILVGTQMLGKGLDLPRLSLVGIINADTSLGVPDFSSSERSYQLLHQAIGRVGRGHPLASGGGQIIVQSFNPDNPLLKAAVQQDWQQFYDQEIAERRQFGFPPFVFLLKITVSRKSSQSAEKFITKLHGDIKKLGLKIQLNDPTPGFYEKSHGKHNWQLIIKAKQRGQLTEVVRRLPAGDYTYDLDPINLL